MEPDFDPEAILGANRNRQVTKKHRDQVALWIGKDWEILATFIDISDLVVSDIKDMYNIPTRRRLVMMQKWYELQGSNATYLKLVNGLNQIKRRDVIDKISELLSNQQPDYSLNQIKRRGVIDKISGLLSNQQPDFRSRIFVHQTYCNCLKNVNTVLLVLLVIITVVTLGLPLYNFVMNSIEPLHEPALSESLSNYTTSTGKNWATNTTFDHQVSVDRGIQNCSQFAESDLPSLFHSLFVDRDADINQVLARITTADIVNINGAPGIGKSMLAICVGYEILKNGTSVRYINIEDKLSLISNQVPRKSEDKTMPERHCCTNSNANNKGALIEFPQRTSLSVLSVSVSKFSGKHDNFFDELQRWSEKINCTSVLILDNCDDILGSTLRLEFLKLIKSLVMKSSLLHIILVLRERLLYIDTGFDSWQVRELNQSTSIQLLNLLTPRIAESIDNESLIAVAELVEGHPLALNVIGRLLDIHHHDGAHLIHEMKKEIITVLDKPSLPVQRFRVIMDIAFNRLGIHKDCGYMLSLFPGSFDKSAGNAITQNECLETYLQHSLLNDYYLPFTHRYKMHRLIKEYLLEKISVADNVTFIIRFRNHFEGLLLTYASKQEAIDTEMYTLKLDFHNLDYLGKLLLMDIESSSSDLAVLAFLLHLQLIQPEQLRKYYALYIRKIDKVCQLLNPKLCGKMYTDVVRYLYQHCKCETVVAFIQNFFISPCMEHFPCEVVTYLLNVSGLLQLSEDELSYIYLVAGSHCSRLSGSQTPSLLITLAILSGLMCYEFYHTSKIYKIVIVCVLLCGLYELGLHFTHEFNFNITTPHLRSFEILLNWLCQYIIISTAIWLMPYMRSSSVMVSIIITLVYCSLACYTYIFKSVSVISYCCHLVPVCI